MFKLKRHLVPFSVIISLLATLCFVFAQESLTITTYYPSPYGSYQDLETGNLTFRYSTSTDGLVHFNNATTYDRRLRITAGFNDTTNNTQGASIDLHGNAHALYPGRLDLVAGWGGNVTFWSSPASSNATERMRITGGGNVYIGEVTPISPGLFNVARIGTSPATTTTVFEQAGGNAYGPTLFLRKARGTVALPTAILSSDMLGTISFSGCYVDGTYNSVLAPAAIIRAYAEGTIDATNRVPARLSFWTKANDSSTSAVERMRITNSGNVGIGTTAPGGYLDVNPTYTGATVANIFNQRSGFTLNNAGTTVANWYGSYIAAPTVTAGTLTDRYALVTEANAGNVGIGRIPTAYRLEVDGVIQALTATNAKGFEHSDGTISLYTWLGTAFTVTGAWLGTGTNHPLFLFTNDSAPQVTLTTTGNLGIGTTAAIPPSQRLTVYNGTTTGTYTTTGWQHTSDKRLKTDISKVDNALDKIASMEGVYFKWKNNPQAGRQIGLVAQDVMNALPETVTKNNDGYYSLAYDEVIPVLVNAVKELKKENEALKVRIDVLEAAR